MSSSLASLLCDTIVSTLFTDEEVCPVSAAFNSTQERHHGTEPTAKADAAPQPLMHSLTVSKDDSDDTTVTQGCKDLEGGWGEEHAQQVEAATPSCMSTSDQEPRQTPPDSGFLVVSCACPSHSEQSDKSSEPAVMTTTIASITDLPCPLPASTEQTEPSKSALDQPNLSEPTSCQLASLAPATAASAATRSGDVPAAVIQTICVGTETLLTCCAVGSPGLVQPMAALTPRPSMAAVTGVDPMAQITTADGDQEPECASTSPADASPSRTHQQEGKNRADAPCMPFPRDHTPAPADQAVGAGSLRLAASAPCLAPGPTALSNRPPVESQPRAINLPHAGSPTLSSTASESSPSAAASQVDSHPTVDVSPTVERSSEKHCSASQSASSAAGVAVELTQAEPAGLYTSRLGDPPGSAHRLADAADAFEDDVPAITAGSVQLGHDKPAPELVGASEEVLATSPCVKDVQKELPSKLLSGCASMLQPEGHGLVQKRSQCCGSCLNNNQELSSLPALDKAGVLTILDACVKSETLRDLIAADVQSFAYESDVLLHSLCRSITEIAGVHTV